jgi:pilus assembly protein CpaC
MHSHILRKHGYITALISFFMFMVIFPPAGRGEPLIVTPESGNTQEVISTVGKSVILGTSQPITRVSLGAPDIADALVLTPQQISIIGRTPGVTNLILWGQNDHPATILDIRVSPDITRLREMIEKICPEEEDIQINAAHDSLTLSGTVSNASNVSKVLALAEPFFPKKVVNLLKVRVSPNVEISSDTSKLKEVELKERIHDTFPEETNINVTTMENAIILSGTISSASSLSQVLALTEAYVPREGKVINLLEVTGVQQVMLEVRIAEMSKSLLRKLGFNFNYVGSSGKNIGLTLLHNLTRLPQGGSFPSTGVDVSDSVNAIFRFLTGGITWTIFIDALKEDGLLKVLAEPTLITLSGKSANFLVGGEFPVPVPQPGSGAVAITVEYKPFGVGLRFTPNVLSNKKISMEVGPEVSDLDFSNAITISGFVIPAIATRKVSTTIELGDGQSFAIAGLLKDDVREIISKFPVLGDIPVLGALFRSTSFQKNETELIVIVTPHLVKPLDIAKQTLPTDQYIEPDDFEFYLLGYTEGKDKSEPDDNTSKGRTSRFEGSFGYMFPKW